MPMFRHVATCVLIAALASGCSSGEAPERVAFADDSPVVATPTSVPPAVSTIEGFTANLDAAFPVAVSNAAVSETSLTEVARQMCEEMRTFADPDELLVRLVELEPEGVFDAPGESFVAFVDDVGSDLCQERWDAIGRAKPE